MQCSQLSFNQLLLSQQGMAAHGYWYCGPEEPKVLPASLKTPWDEVNRRLGRKGSYLSGEDVQLYNFSYNESTNHTAESGRPYDCQSLDFKIENLNMLQPLWSNKAGECLSHPILTSLLVTKYSLFTFESNGTTWCIEIVFHLAFCEMAKAAAPLMRFIAHAQDAVQRQDDDKLLAALQAISECVENVQKAFMKIIPDPRAKLGIEPLVWAKTVAPVGVSFNKGMPSPSGLGTPFFHCLDIFFSRGKYQSILGKDSVGAREFFPENWHRVLNAISQISIHVYVTMSENEELYNAWSQYVKVPPHELHYANRMCSSNII